MLHQSTAMDLFRYSNFAYCNTILFIKRNKFARSLDLRKQVIQQKNPEVLNISQEICQIPAGIFINRTETVETRCNSINVVL